MRIWKALFCMWHSDKPKVQAELAETLGALVHAARGGKHWLFIRVFWATMVREWPGLDRLRLNKFYQLLGRQLHHSIRLLAATGWAADDARRLGAIWKEGPLAAASPAGLKYFLIDTIVGALREEWRADADADADADGGRRRRQRRRAARAARAVLLAARRGARGHRRPKGGGEGRRAAARGGGGGRRR